jgi:hypothetical protein
MMKDAREFADQTHKCFWRVARSATVCLGIHKLLSVKRARSGQGVPPQGAAKANARAKSWHGSPLPAPRTLGER